MEYDCAGLASPDGTPREVCAAVKNFSETLNENAELFGNAKTLPADVAIVFDYDCALMSLVEDNCGDLYDFKQSNPLNYYRRSVSGAYRLLRENDYRVDFIRSAKLSSDCAKYKALYFPYYCMIDKNAIPALENFVKNGGVIIADEGFGLRTQNTWLQPYDIDFKPILNAKMLSRREKSAKVKCGNNIFETTPYFSHYRVEGGEVIARFDDGAPAAFKTALGKGFVYLFGFSLGYSCESNKDASAKLFNDILSPLAIAKYGYSNAKDGVYEQTMRSGDKQISVILNASNEPFELSTNDIVDFDKEFIKTDNKLTLPPLTSSYLVKK